MNRVIKFRGWNGQRMVHPERLVVSAGEWFEDGRSYENWIPGHADWLMQFTGLHDKNGKEIYEGDIVEWDVDSLNWEVYWHPEEGAWMGRDNHTFGGGIGAPEMIGHGCTVIGNMHETPELLDAEP